MHTKKRAAIAAARFIFFYSVLFFGIVFIDRLKQSGAFD